MIDTIYIWHWMEDVEDFQVDKYKDFRGFKLEDGWMYIQLNETSPDFEKHKDMNGLLVIEFDPENDTIELF